MLHPQLEFTEEEPDGPFQGLIQRYRQPFGKQVVRFQYPGADGAHQEGAFVYVDLYQSKLLNYYLLTKYSLGFIPCL